MGLMIAVLAGFGGFLGFFHAMVAAINLSCIRSSPDLNLVSPEMDLFIILTCLAVAWILGYFQKGIFNFHQIGTRFYGREQTSQGTITTKWLVAGFPVLPIRSYIVVHRVKEISNYEFEYQQNAMQPVEGYFYWRQMLRTALISYGTMVWCLGCLWVMFMGPCV